VVGIPMPFKPRPHQHCSWLVSLTPSPSH
jgi:hypothetical protein